MKKKNCLIVEEYLDNQKIYDKYDLVLSLRSHKSHQKKIISIQKYIENHEYDLKTEYLYIIKNIENKFNKINSFNLEKKFNFFNLSLINEKNPFNSNMIYNVINYLSIQNLVLEKNIKIISYFGNDISLTIFLRNLTKKNKLIFKTNNSNIQKLLHNILKFKNLIKNIYSSFREIIYISRLIVFIKKNFKNRIKNYDYAIYTQFAHAYKKNNYVPSPWYNFDILTKNKNKLWCFFYVKTNEFKDLNELKKIFSKNKSLNYMFIQGLGSFKLILKTLQTYTLFMFNYFLIDKKKLFEVNKTDFYDIFYEDFQKSFLGSESIKNISNYYFIKKFQQEYNFKNIFYLFEGQPHEKCLNFFFKKNQI